MFVTLIYWKKISNTYTERLFSIFKKLLKFFFYTLLQCDDAGVLLLLILTILIMREKYSFISYEAQTVSYYS
jgi:hypothetical protein